jgi:hypothetical protein
MGRSQSYLGDTLLVNDWSLDPFTIDDDQLIRLLLHMLYEFNVIELLQTNKMKLIGFLGAVRSKYRNNAFHNFKHAFGVMHLSFNMLKLGASEYLSPLEMLAVLLSAFCHDLDHPGNTKYVV